MELTTNRGIPKFAGANPASWMIVLVGVFSFEADYNIWIGIRVERPYLFTCDDSNVASLPFL